MRIIIDGQRIPVNARTSKDILLTLRSIGKILNWGMFYDAAKEVVYINSKSSSPPVPPPDRQLSGDTIESTRLVGKTICLDPGHGGADPGTTGGTGTREKDNTLAIALLLRDRLEKNGASIIMTRDSDKESFYPGSSADEELGSRVDAANEGGADIFVSIHNDSFTNPSTSGTTTYHYGDAESTRLAALVQKCLVEELGTRDRGARYASFYVIRYTDMPAILIEVAFISNPEEEVLLASVDGRYKAAESIFQGIVKYFKV
ncbi:MAG: N-acetylmuramoyl-L-alanine amidase [Negativicutes bacterium]|nr:N-acetylmuramoyl-L-alanine amidase [Negativicutes bacterium]